VALPATMPMETDSALSIRECYWDEAPPDRVKRADNRDDNECLKFKPNVRHGPSEVSVIKSMGLFESLQRLSTTNEGAEVLVKLKDMLRLINPI